MGARANLLGDIWLERQKNISKYDESLLKNPPAHDTLNEYRESIKRRLLEDYIPFRLAESQDVQRDKGANAEFTRASDYTIKSLNKELKEQAEIFF